MKISDKEVALKMAISRTPVREALVRLSEQGLVRFHHNRGFKVRSFTPKDVDNLYTLRESLERLAVRQAIANLNNDRIQALKSLVDKYLVCTEKYLTCVISQFNLARKFIPIHAAEPFVIYPIVSTIGFDPK